MDGREQLEYILDQTNPFLILGVDEDATDKEIRTAYKKLVKHVHPDRFPDPGLNAMAKEAFISVGQAHNDLRDPLKRKDFERMLSNLRASGAAPPKKSTTSTSTSQRPKSPQEQAAPAPKKEAPKPPPEPEIDLQKQKEAQAEAQFDEAKKLLKKNNVDEAINAYQEAIRINNTVAKYHSALGQALDRKGWGGYAQAEYKVALHFDPTDKIALKNYQPSGGSPAENKKKIGGKFFSLFKNEDKNVRIGSILMEKGFLNKTQLKDALKKQSQEKMLLGEILIQKKYIRPEHLAEALIAQAEVLNKVKK